MTGRDVHRIRTELGLTTIDFAELVGVGLSTLYRWEQAAAAKINIDPFQTRLLAMLKRRLAQLSAQQRSGLGRRLRSALAEHGALYALFVLLRASYGARQRAA